MPLINVGLFKYTHLKRLFRIYTDVQVESVIFIGGTRLDEFLYGDKPEKNKILSENIFFWVSHFSFDPSSSALFEFILPNRTDQSETFISIGWLIDSLLRVTHSFISIQMMPEFTIVWKNAYSREIFGVSIVRTFRNSHILAGSYIHLPRTDRNFSSQCLLLLLARKNSIRASAEWVYRKSGFWKRLEYKGTILDQYSHYTHCTVCYR